MAVNYTNFSNSIAHFPPITTPRSRFSASRSRFRCSSAATSNSMDSGKVKLMEFPYASVPTKKLMVELLSTVDDQLGSSLQPSCTLAPDVQYFGNSTDTAHASLHLRSGLPSSQVRFLLFFCYALWNMDRKRYFKSWIKG